MFTPGSTVPSHAASNGILITSRQEAREEEISMLGYQFRGNRSGVQNAKDTSKRPEAGCGKVKNYCILNMESSTMLWVF